MTSIEPGAVSQLSDGKAGKPSLIHRQEQFQLLLSIPVVQIAIFVSPSRTSLRPS
jgi:hypothetical protein